MKVRGLVRNDAKDGVKWEDSVMGSKRLTPTRVGKMASKCLLFVLFLSFSALRYFLELLLNISAIFSGCSHL